jgi:D-cysteine desulfhydrase
MKRDDLTGLEVSGNKVRKLEYIAAEALASGCDTLVTEGTSQSNHCRATAAVCARLGMQAVLLFRPAAPELPQGNHLLDVLFGAQTRSFPRPEYAAQRERIIADVLAELKAAGRKPRFTPAGSSEPLGCWGYLRAARELAEQLQAAGIGECDVLVAISSGAAVRRAALGPDAAPAGFVAALGGSSKRQRRGTHREGDGALPGGSRAVRPAGAVRAGALAFIDGYVGEGYAVPYPAEIEGLRLLAHTEAIVLDRYTRERRSVLCWTAFAAVGSASTAGSLHPHGGIFSDFAWPRLLLESV